MVKVSFDGITKLITVNSGSTSVDVRTELYTPWVDWLKESGSINSKWNYALRYIGGDPTVNGEQAGIIFFTQNGWRIYFDHNVIFNGAIFSDDFPTPFTTPSGTFLGQTIVSSLVTHAPILTRQETSDAVWQRMSTENNPSGSVGEYVFKKLLSISKFIGLK